MSDSPDIRMRLAEALPFFVIFLWGLTWFEDSGHVERLVNSLGLTFGLYVGAQLAYGLLSHAVSRIAGVKSTYADLKLDKIQEVTFVLIAAGVWMLGQHWVEDKVETVVECVEEEAYEDVVSSFSSEAAVVRWCAEEYGAAD